MHSYVWTVQNCTNFMEITHITRWTLSLSLSLSLSPAKIDNNLPTNLFGAMLQIQGENVT